MRPATTLVLAAFAAAGLAGCGGSPDGSSDAEDSGDPGATSGPTFAEGVSLPEAYPLEDVPLVDGEVTHAEETTDYHGWPEFVVTVESLDPFDEVVAATREALVGAGLEEGGEAYESEGYLETRFDADDLIVELYLQEATDTTPVDVDVDYVVVEIPETGLPAPATVAPMADGLIYEVLQDPTLSVRMLVEGSVDEVVAQIQDQLAAAGYLAGPGDEPSPSTDGSVFFGATGPDTSIAIYAGVDDSTGRTDVQYQFWEN